MADTGDSGATLHVEFNKSVKEYATNYTNPVTSGQIQDSLHKESEKSPDNSESTVDPREVYVNEIASPSIWNTIC